MESNTRPGTAAGLARRGGPGTGTFAVGHRAPAHFEKGTTSRPEITNGSNSSTDKLHGLEGICLAAT